MSAPTNLETSSNSLSLGSLNVTSYSPISLILCFNTSLTHSISVKSKISHFCFFRFAIAFNYFKFLLNPGYTILSISIINIVFVLCY